MNKQAEIALKFYEARDVVHNLLGTDKFIAKVDEYRPIVENICKQKGISKLQATIAILDVLKQDGMATLVAMAACTEIMEPSLNRKISA
jgi:hypothetical protein